MKPVVVIDLDTTIKRGECTLQLYILYMYVLIKSWIVIAQKSDIIITLNSQNKFMYEVWIISL